MEKALNGGYSGKRVLMYDPVLRGYGYYIDVALPEIQYIGFCPFCGKGLPEMLENEFLDTIYEELGQEFLPKDWTTESREHLPPEFQTDEWWKKRGL
jgi:hypothetical protein